MKASHIWFALIVLFISWAGAANACNHDILCPEKWVWSDDEGTCVEAEPGTT